MRRTWMLGLLTVVACGGAPATTEAPTAESDLPTFGPRPPLERWDIDGRALTVPDDGPCGGLGALSDSQEAHPLRDRLRLTLPARTHSTPAPYNVMAAPTSADVDEILRIEEGEARMAVRVSERFRTAEGLEAYLDAVLPADWRREEVTTSGQLEAIVVRPRLVQRGSDTVLLQAFVTAADGLVVDLLFITTPEIAESGGCVDLARGILQTAAPGERSVDRQGGPRTLFDELTVELPADHGLFEDRGPDFSVYRVVPILPYDTVDGFLGIYAGGHPSFAASGNSRTVSMLGREVEWFDSTWEARGGHRSDALVQLGDYTFLHVFYGSNDRDTYGGLRRAAESLRRAPSP